ncbi:MAG: helix-turn-helix domain-containing protein [Planctomycetota bacterium]
MDQVFAALAHGARRRMLDLLIEAPGMSVKALASHFEFSRIATLKHLDCLQKADLVLSEKAGRQRHLYFNAVPVQRIYDRWTTQYSSFWAGRVTDLQARVEAHARKKKHA